MTEIRSYRAVFELERRIYRIDRLRLNPAGIPVRGAVYFLVLVMVSLVGEQLPVSSVIARALPWYALDIALPGTVAALLTIVKIEGRPFHIAGQALLMHALCPRHLVSLSPRRATEPRGSAERAIRWSPPEVVILPDGSDRVMRRLSYRGPGAVLVAVEHERLGPPANASGSCRLGRWVRRPRLELREHGGESPNTVVVLDRGVEVRTG
jgi:hypothetical protein